MKKQNALISGFKIKEPPTKKKVSKLVDKINKPKSTGTSKRKKSIEEVIRGVAEYSQKVAQRLPNYTFKLVTDIDELYEYLYVALKNGVISFDTETTGLDVFTNKVVGISLYTPGMPAIYVPYKHLNYENNVDITNFIRTLKTLSMEEKITVVMANAMFDQRISKQTFSLDNYIRCMWDVILASRFLNENEKFKNLKFLWEKYIMGTPEKDIVPDSYKALFGNYTFDVFNPELIVTYPALDAVMTYQLYEFQKQYLHKDGQYTEAAGLSLAASTFVTANYLTEVVAQMMDNGIALDLDAIGRLQNLLGKQVEEARLIFDSEVDKIAEEFLTPLMKDNPELFAKIERPLNCGSSTQLAILFYDAMNLHQYKKRSVDESVVERLQKKYPQYKQLFVALINYRKANKLLGTYADGLFKRIHPETGRVHTQFKPYGARTGRYTSKDPNLQNIPSRTEIGKEIRKAFVPTEGYYLIGSDYSQQEPRLLAFTSGDKEMQRAYAEGRDLYANTASIVYNLPYEQCLESYGKEGKQRRSNMKSVILGIMYSRGAKSIAEQLNISEGAAKSIISKFYQGFPTIKAYVDQQHNFCKSNGYVYTVWGRKGRIPEFQLPPYEITSKQQLDDYTKKEIINDLSHIWKRDKKQERINFYKNQFGINIKDNTGQIAAAKRQIVNTVIQGSAVDMINEALVMLHFDKEFNELGGRILLTVHDEIIGEAPKENAKAALKRMEIVMVEASKRYVSVPMKCDGEILERWAGTNIKDTI